MFSNNDDTCEKRKAPAIVAAMAIYKKKQHKKDSFSLYIII